MPIFHGDVVLGHVYYHVTETAVGYPWYNFYQNKDKIDFFGCNEVLIA